jgi:ABC-type sugar transport system substrate-binding protein
MKEDIMAKRAGVLSAVALVLALGLAADAHAQAKKPNILVIMGDDIG